MVLLAFALAVIDASGPFEPLWLMVGVPIMATAYGMIGLVAWRRRPSNLIGPLLVLRRLDVARRRPRGHRRAGPGRRRPQPGHVAGRRDDPRRPGVPDRSAWQPRGVRIAVVAYANTTLLQIPQYMFRPSPMQVTDNDIAEAIVRNGQRIIFLAVAAAVVVVVVRRLREASQAPAGAAAAVPLRRHLHRGDRRDPHDRAVPRVVERRAAGDRAVLPRRRVPDRLRRSACCSVSPAPARSRSWPPASADDLDRAGLVAAIADALGDPSAELWFWMAPDGRYVDHHGQPVRARTGDRGLAPIDLGGRHIGAIVYDPLLFAEPDLPLAAGRMMAIALDRERLDVELVANRDALRAIAAPARRCRRSRAPPHRP